MDRWSWFAQRFQVKLFGVFFFFFLQFYFIISSFCFMYFSPVEEFFGGPDYFCSRSHTTLFNTIFFFISVNEHIFLHVFHVLTQKTRISYNYIWSKYVVYLEHWDTSSDTAYVDVFTLHVPTFSLMYFFFPDEPVSHCMFLHAYIIFMIFFLVRI